MCIADDTRPDRDIKVSPFRAMYQKNVSALYYSLPAAQNCQGRGGEAVQNAEFKIHEHMFLTRTYV